MEEKEKNNSGKINEKENRDQNIDIVNRKNWIKSTRNKLNIKNKIYSAKLPLNKTSKDFLTEKLKLNEFTGFFNKKFNLDLYRKIRENTRLKIKSPQKRIILTQKRGNGIPDVIFERMKFLDKKFNDPKFLKYYNNKPEKKDYNFDEVINYLVKYSKIKGDLESIMMAFYFVCKEIKFDKECYNNNEETKFNQKPINVYDEGMGVSSGFTNLFEYILKKMEIKYKHIDGYCKLLPKKKPLKKIKKGNKLNRVQSAKNFTETINELNDTVNHSWTAFFLRGEWYFCDCLFGSGSVEQEEDLATKINLKQLDINNNLYNYNSTMTNGNTTKNNEPSNTFNFFYFMIPPELLISTHRPIDEMWQFIPKTLSFKEFYNSRKINYGEFYKNVHKYKVKLLSHLNPFISITTKEKLEIKIKVPHHLLEANLFYSFRNTKIADVKYIYDETNDIYILKPIFPQKGEYILKINARALDSTDLLYWPLLDYIIKIDSFFQVNEDTNFLTQKETKLKTKKLVKEIFPKLNKNSSAKNLFTPKIVTDYSKIFPPKTVKKICYDKEDLRILEPKNCILKKGINSKFRILAKGAVSLSILDGNHMTFLKRHEDGIFFGQREIETNNVSLCCLRGKNIFTELYKFKVLNNDRILSSKPTQKRKKFLLFK